MQEYRVLYVGDGGATGRPVPQPDDSRGLAVIEASSPDAALNRLRADGRIDCLLVESNRSGLDGLAFLSAVRDLRPAVPFVLRLEDGGTEPGRAIEAGVTDCIGLPGSASDEVVLNRVENYAARYRQQRELERYRATMETVPDGVFLLDDEGVMTWVNPAWESYVGYDQDELVGEPFLKLVREGIIDDSVVETYLNLVAELLSSETDREVGKFTTEATPPDDDRDHVYEIHVGLLPYDDEFQGTAGVVRDITEKRARQRRLERENERLEEFASIISHDLRNPLNVVEGSLRLAEETGESSHFERGRQATERMEQLIEDLLTLARQGQQIESVARIELPDLCRACWETVETGDATLRVEASGTVPADESRLRQLLENLFRNAVEHGSTSSRSEADTATEHGGAGVTVTVGHLAGAPGFYVADDGPGIPEKERGDVLESGYSSTETGTGFGLAIVSEIADAHGWTVAVTESEDGGARFEFEVA
jgi:PAS domain S-box-containing protein